MKKLKNLYEEYLDKTFLLCLETNWSTKIFKALIDSSIKYTS